MAAPIYGDIKFADKSYRIDIDTYRVKDIIDFAPRASVPGGSVVMSDLSLYQPIVQTDWRHGMGFQWDSDELGYLSTTGNIDTRQEGIVMMFTHATSSDSDNNVKEGFCTFNGDVFAWGAAGLRKCHNGTWSSVYATGAVNFALPAGDYLFFCPDGARIQKMTTAGTVTDAGLDTNSTDYKWLIIHNGFIFAGKDGTNMIHYSAEPDLSDLEGTSSDPGVIYCGVGNIPTIRAIRFAGALYVARSDGLWQLGDDFICRGMIDYSNEASSNNFRGMCIVNGYLVYPIRDRVIQWNGARVADITPMRVTDNFPYVTYGTYDNFVATNDYLYCTAKTNETPYSIGLIVWDGVGWHKLMDLVTNGTDDITAMGYDVVNNYLWYHLNATADATYYIPFSANSPFPYADFPTTGTHNLITSRMEMGFRRVQKSMVSLWVEGRNLLVGHRYINVYYSLDGGDWVLWDTVNTDGPTELTHPAGNVSREFYYMNLRFDFSTDDGTQSPILESYTLRFIMRPDTKMGYNFNIIAATNYQYGSREMMVKANTIIKEIREFRNQKAPFTFLPLYGSEVECYITSVSETPVWRPGTKDDGDDRIEYAINVNVVEAG